MDSLVRYMSHTWAFRLCQFSSVLCKAVDVYLLLLGLELLHMYMLIVSSCTIAPIYPSLILLFPGC